MNSKLDAIKSGRYVASAVTEPIQVPLTPSGDNTSGLTEHIDAPMAESIPAIRNPFPLCALAFFTSGKILRSRSDILFDSQSNVGRGRAPQRDCEKTDVVCSNSVLVFFGA